MMQSPRLEGLGLLDEQDQNCDKPFDDSSDRRGDTGDV